MIDRILLNARIYTLNPAQPRVSALAIACDRIVAAGDDDAIRALAGPRTAVDRLNGQMIIPGLTDAHIHWEGVARALHDVDLLDVPSKAEALRRVAERARQTPPGQWIVGRGWSQALWPDGAFPTAADLDSVAPDHPVYLAARSGHAAWVNSLALQRAEIGAHTLDPPGGRASARRSRQADRHPAGGPGHEAGRAADSRSHARSARRLDGRGAAARLGRRADRAA